MQHKQQSVEIKNLTGIDKAMPVDTVVCVTHPLRFRLCVYFSVSLIFTKITDYLQSSGLLEATKKKK